MAAKIFDRYGRVGAVDYKYTGEEPEWKDWEKFEPTKFMKERTRMLAFYNYYLNVGDLRKDILLWMKSHGYTKDEINQIRNIGQVGVSFTAAKLCRAMNLGMPPRYDRCMEYNEATVGVSATEPHDDELYVRNELRRLIQTGPRKKSMGMTDREDTEKKGTSVGVNPFERLKTSILDTIVAQLDWMLDDWVTEKNDPKPINIHAALKANKTPAMGLKFIIEWLDRHQDELEEALNGTDKDSVEGYSYLTKKGLRDRIKCLKKIRDDVDKYKAYLKVSKKPRVKKPVSASKLTKDVKYLKESEDLAITSIDPSSIPGAKNLYLYNTKQNKLLVLKGGKNLLEVKGTTVRGFDPALSFITTLRKPLETTTAILTKTTEKQIDIVLEALTTKKTPAAGRINPDTLILKVL